MLSQCPSFISVAVIKHPDKKRQLRGERLHSYCNSRFWSIISGKSRQQTLEALVTSIGKKRDRKNEKECMKVYYPAYLLYSYI